MLHQGKHATRPKALQWGMSLASCASPKPLGHSLYTLHLPWAIMGRLCSTARANPSGGRFVPRGLFKSSARGRHSFVAKHQAKRRWFTTENFNKSSNGNNKVGKNTIPPGDKGSKASDTWTQKESTLKEPTSTETPPFTKAQFEASFWQWFKKDKNWVFSSLGGAPFPKIVLFFSFLYGGFIAYSVSQLEQHHDDKTQLESSIASVSVLPAIMEEQPAAVLGFSAISVAASSALAAWWVPRRTAKSANIFANNYCPNPPVAATLAEAKGNIKKIARQRGMVGAAFLCLGMTFITVQLPYLLFKEYITDMNGKNWEEAPKELPSFERYRAYSIAYFALAISSYYLSLRHTPFVVVPCLFSSILGFPLFAQSSENMVKVATRLARVQASELYLELAAEDHLLAGGGGGGEEAQE